MRCTDVPDVALWDDDSVPGTLPAVVTILSSGAVSAPVLQSVRSLLWSDALFGLQLRAVLGVPSEGKLASCECDDAVPLRSREYHSGACVGLRPIAETYRAR